MNLETAKHETVKQEALTHDALTNEGVKKAATYLFFVLFLVVSTFIDTSAIQAQPQQRIIVGLEAALSGDDEKSLKESIEKILSEDMLKAESSSDTRWVIILKNRLDKTYLQKAITAIGELPHVAYVEADGLLIKQ